MAKIGRICINTNKIKDAVIDTLFPKSCPLCDKTMGRGLRICRSCENKVHYIEEPKCKKCGKQLSEEEVEYCLDCRTAKHVFNTGIAAFLYDDTISKSIYRFKYHNRRTYAEYYGKAIAEKYEKQIRRWRADVIIPVPIHEKKRIKRGYNQAELIAEEIGKQLGIKVDCKYLERTVNTKPQKEMDKAGRKKNLENAFKIRYNIVEYKKIILVDDIYTTGSTIDGCARVLMEGGATEVNFISLSIGAGI